MVSLDALALLMFNVGFKGFLFRGTSQHQDLASTAVDFGPH